MHEIRIVDIAIDRTINPASQITSLNRNNDSYTFTGLVNIDRPYAVNGLNQYSSAGSAVFTYDTSDCLSTGASRRQNLGQAPPTATSSATAPAPTPMTPRTG